MATNFTDLRAEIKAQIKPNGVGAITGQVMQDAMLNLVGATEAEMSALNAATDEKLAQLDQEFQAIKDANFNVLVNPHIEIVEPQGNVITIDSDKFYKWGEVANLAITFNAPSAPYVGSYIFQFTCPADAATSLAMPIEVMWNKTPLIEAGKTYQVSVVNNLAVITAWGNNEE